MLLFSVVMMVVGENGKLNFFPKIFSSVRAGDVQYNQSARCRRGRDARISQELPDSIS